MPAGPVVVKVASVTLHHMGMLVTMAQGKAEYAELVGRADHADQAQRSPIESMRASRSGLDLGEAISTMTRKTMNFCSGPTLS